MLNSLTGVFGHSSRTRSGILDSALVKERAASLSTHHLLAVS